MLVCISSVCDASTTNKRHTAVYPSPKRFANRVGKRGVKHYVGHLNYVDKFSNFQSLDDTNRANWHLLSSFATKDGQMLIELSAVHFDPQPASLK